MSVIVYNARVRHHYCRLLCSHISAYSCLLEVLVLTVLLHALQRAMRAGMALEVVTDAAAAAATEMVMLVAAVETVEIVEGHHQAHQQTARLLRGLALLTSSERMTSHAEMMTGTASLIQ
jgi:hypothetical protein